jgi:hypothetical protein
MAVIKFNYGKIYAIPAHTVLFPCGILMGPSAQKHENLLARIDVDVDVGNGRAPDAFLQKKKSLDEPEHAHSSATYPKFCSAPFLGRFYQAGCFPLHEGLDSRPRNRRGGLTCDMYYQCCESAYQPSEHLAGPWLGSRRRHRDMPKVSFYLRCNV